MKNKMAQLIKNANYEGGGTPEEIDTYAKELLLRLGMGDLSDIHQSKSDTDVCVEVSTYLLWKSLNG